jgi:CheY-like chemotaxis protein
MSLGGTTIKILLADDDADDRLLFETIYAERADIQLWAGAINGVEALQKLNSVVDDKDLPDLIILDQNMPRMTGKQTLAILKSTPRYAHIPVCIYSTYADSNLIADCLQLGAARILNKPITNEDYQVIMDEFVSTVDAYPR